jgi:glycosidase
MALWYKGTGPWWDSTKIKPFDGISLQEEQPDPQSLYNWYRKLLTLRKAYSVLQTGDYVALDNTNPQVFSWSRGSSASPAWVVVNLSGQHQQTTLRDVTPAGMHQVFGNATTRAQEQQFVIDLPPYGAGVWIAQNQKSK